MWEEITTDYWDVGGSCLFPLRSYQAIYQAYLPRNPFAWNLSSRVHVEHCTAFGKTSSSPMGPCKQEPWSLNLMTLGSMLLGWARIWVWSCGREQWPGRPQPPAGRGMGKSQLVRGPGERELILLSSYQESGIVQVSPFSLSSSAMEEVRLWDVKRQTWLCPSQCSFSPLLLLKPSCWLGVSLVGERSLLEDRLDSGQPERLSSMNHDAHASIMPSTHIHVPTSRKMLAYPEEGFSLGPNGTLSKFCMIHWQLTSMGKSTFIQNNSLGSGFFPPQVCL